MWSTCLSFLRLERRAWRRRSTSFAPLALALSLLASVIALSSAATVPTAPLSTLAPPFREVSHPQAPSGFFASSVQRPYPTNAWFMNAVLGSGEQPIVPYPYAVSLRSPPPPASAVAGQVRLGSTVPFRGEARNATRPSLIRNILNATRSHSTSVERVSFPPSRFTSMLLNTSDHASNRASDHASELHHVVGAGSRSGSLSGASSSLQDVPNYGAMVSLPEKHVEASLVAMHFKPNMMLTASMAELRSHQITRFDRVSVDVVFNQVGGGGSMTLPLVRGAPYVTALYRAMTPRLFTGNAILNLNGQAEPGTVTARTLVMRLNNDQTVIVYADREAQWRWDRNQAVLVEATPSDWTLRLSILSPSQSTAAAVTSAKAVLDAYASCVPIRGAVSWDVTDPHVDVTYTWTTLTPCVPLTFVLPHQADHLMPVTGAANASSLSALAFDSIKGALTPVAARSFTVRLPAVPVAWGAPRPIATPYVAELRQQLRVDALEELPDLPDSYGFGKLASKMGRLALIADELGEGGTASALRAQMRQRIGDWLSMNNTDTLLFDGSWGGVITLNGFRDRNAEFGQAWYNDHHFHFGYFVYALACALRPRDAASLQFIDQYRESILALVRDYANPSDADASFTPMRHQDAWDGHSWAAGIFEFGDGRNQESSSESLNAYYAIALLGDAMADERLQTLGRAAVASELAAVLKYWHMSTESSVYPVPYSAHKCAGMVWSMKVVDATFFASGAVYVHGINILPFSPLTEWYLPQAWVREQYPVMEASVSTSNPAPTDAWLGIMYGALAVLDPVRALERLRAMSIFDNGNTLTNMIYWVATRPM